MPDAATASAPRPHRQRSHDERTSWSLDPTARIPGAFVEPDEGDIPPEDIPDVPDPLELPDLPDDGELIDPYDE